MQSKSTSERQHVLILSADRFEDSELLQPYQQLLDKGLVVDVASLKAGTIRGKHGMEIAVNLPVDEVVADNYDMLILPGGKAPEELRKHQRVLDIARQFFRQNKPVAAICHGPQILISAGLMQDRTATAYPSVADEMKEAGAHYRDAEVVVDGNLITARRPADIPAFMREVMAHLKNP